MGEGYANTEIASELGISSNTVKTYVKSLMQKLPEFAIARKQLLKGSRSS